VKKIKDLPAVLVDKKDEIAQYIKTNNVSGKTDQDWEIVINYYNSLK
jgi:hypothetical protein